MSKTVANTIKNSTKVHVGSAPWSAPEYLNPRRINERNGKGDVFSFGVIVWEIVTGLFPWESEKYGHMDIAFSVNAGEQLVIPDTCNDILRNIMQGCWNQGKISLCTVTNWRIRSK